MFPWNLISSHSASKSVWRASLDRLQRQNDKGGVIHNHGRGYRGLYRTRETEC
jgi:hypothetical protein